MLTRRQLLLTTPAAALAATKKAPQRPNLVLILADDLGAWMLGCYGNREIKTPHIDELSRMGARFINSFVATPAGSPSLATLLTGRTPSQHGIEDFLTEKPIEDPPVGQKAAPPSFANEILLSDLLGKQGYNCGYCGRWNLGGDEQPGHGLGFTYTLKGPSSPYQNPVMYRNGQRTEEQGYLADLITQRAGEYIDQQKAEKPFFLTVSYLNPHTPYEGHPQKYYDLYSGTPFTTTNWEPPARNALVDKEMLGDIVGNSRRAAAATAALDDQVAALLKRLRDRNLGDNTLVIFTSTTGFLLGRHGLWSAGHASNPPNMYEEVIGVPMLWSWPGKIPAEASVPEVVTSYDFLPTICELTGAAVPDRHLSGRSYAPLVLRQPLPKKQPWRNVIYGQLRNTDMVRDSRFKLILRNGGQGPNELFDLDNDRAEKKNLYDSPDFLTVRNALTKEIAGWRQRTSA
jgi:arylsulfatase A-like enzyme